MRQTIFLFMMVFMGIAYFVQYTIIQNLVDDHVDENSSNSPQQQNSNNNHMIQQQQSTPQTPPPVLRTRILQSKVHAQLQQAMQAVDNLVQPPLGPKTDWDDPSLQPYNTDLRGTDLSLPQNTALRENRLIYLITPTYVRQTQVVDLTRVGQTLRLAREAGYHQRLYWIILEDATKCTYRVRQLALETGVPFAHKAVQTPLKIKRMPKAHRGIEQRNAGLDIVEQIGKDGVVYFMDDDNAYHVQLFHELSYTTHVSVFGTGLPGGSAYERCHVDEATGKVDKLLTTWAAPRVFAVDMAGFAFATHHLARNTAAKTPMRFAHKSKAGYLENDLMLYAAKSVPELQPLAANCTRILSWHVKTKGNDLYYNPEPNKERFNLYKGLV